jgi:hypothetical protein
MRWADHVANVGEKKRTLLVTLLESQKTRRQMLALKLHGILSIVIS